VADTLEKRVADRDYLLAHIDELFAGVDVKLAGLRELILLQNGRFTKIEAQLRELSTKLEARLNQLERKSGEHAGKLDEILARLPKP
jgi:predicted  nucleic acid-binding Zn-ribbon protein